MNLLTIATVVFFLGYGINVFWPKKWLTIVVGVAAIAVGVLQILPIHW